MAFYKTLYVVFIVYRDGHCLPVFESRFIPDKKNPAVFTAKYLIYNGTDIEFNVHILTSIFEI